MLTPPLGYTWADLIFDEQFVNGTLDPARWNPWLGDDTFGRWSNQGQLPTPYSGPNTSPTPPQVNYCDPYPYGTPTAIGASHMTGGAGLGRLALIASPDSNFTAQGYSWASAAVSSYGKVYLPATGGYVQIAAKMPNSLYGAWAGLWLLSATAPELDIMESGYVLAGVGANRTFAANWHGGGPQAIMNAGLDLSAAYHTYGVEYRPGTSWKVYLDGTLMTTWTNSVPTGAQYQLVIDLEVAGPVAAGWHTVCDPTNHPGPFELDVSDVQIYGLP